MNLEWIINYLHLHVHVNQGFDRPNLSRGKDGKLQALWTKGGCAVNYII